jgi:hypothetical protein
MRRFNDCKRGWKTNIEGSGDERDLSKIAMMSPCGSDIATTPNFPHVTFCATGDNERFRVAALASAQTRVSCTVIVAFRQLRESVGRELSVFRVSSVSGIARLSAIGVRHSGIGGTLRGGRNT